VPFPCLPDAIVCGLVERVNVPDVQVADALAPLPFAALLQVNWMALRGTNGQLVKEAAAALTPRVQVLVPPFMCHVIVAVVFPLTGVVSGSGELNVIVAGVTVTLPVTAKANVLTMILDNAAAATGRFDLQTAAWQTVEKTKHAQIVRRSTIRAAPLGCRDRECRDRRVTTGFIHRIVG
jgi:hypothetical protein